MANAQFGFDGCEPFFWGYREESWEQMGYARFRADAIDVIFHHFDEADCTRLRRLGEVLLFDNPDTGEPESMFPDEVGLCQSMVGASKNPNN